MGACRLSFVLTFLVKQGRILGFSADNYVRRLEESIHALSFLFCWTQRNTGFSVDQGDDMILCWRGTLQCMCGVCVQEKTGLFCVAFVRVEDASFVRSLLFRCKAVQESLLTWVASVCVCETRKYHASWTKVFTHEKEPRLPFVHTFESNSVCVCVRVCACVESRDRYSTIDRCNFLSYLSG